MLKACILFFLSLAGHLANAQVPFEGKITFALTTEDKDRTGSIEVYYGKEKVKGIIKNAGGDIAKNSIKLIDFAKGVSYEVNDSSRSYTMDSIGINPDKSLLNRYQASGKTRNILDQSCSEFFYIDTTKNDFFGNLDFKFWYADSLFFPVDRKYSNSDDIVMFTNGTNLGMGMKMKMEVLKKPSFLDLQPIRIEPMQLAPSLFELPAGYSLNKKDSQTRVINQEGRYSVEMSEVKVEEIKSPPPPPPPPPPASKKKEKNRP